MNYGALYDVTDEDGDDDLIATLNEVARERGHSQTLYADDWTVGFVVAVCDDADRMIEGNSGLFGEVSTFVVELSGDYWRFSTPVSSWMTIRGSTADRISGTKSGFFDFLELVEPSASTSFLIPSRKVELLVEEFVGTWNRFSSELPFDPDTRRIAEALVLMAAEVIKADEPPAGLLKEAFSWLGSKMDLFADEAFKTAGKTAGVIVPGMAAASAAGGLPRLAQLAHMIVGAI